MKGIILAGGHATRLYPITTVVSKQLLPIYDKPMIYYPLSVLLLAGIKEVLIITAPEALSSFQKLLGDGRQLGIKIEYRVQEKPRGLADAFILGKEFIGRDSVCLILGDNLFFGDGMQALLKEAMSFTIGGTIFAYNVKDPQRYGVVEFDADWNALSIEEKPQQPKSHWAITGLYFLDNNVVQVAHNVKPSKRGELEITDVLNAYLNKKSLKVITLGRGYAWLDTGTYDSLIDASNFVRTLQERQGLKLGCIEEIAYNKGFITKEQLHLLADHLKTSYGEYLKGLN